MSNFKPAHWIIALISLALISFVGWANWAELDQVTRAPGNVVPYTRVQIIQSEEGGVISAIHVREGDLVDQGDVLVELATVKLAAQLEEDSAKVAALRSRMSRIDAELFNKPLTFPASLSGYPEFTANQRQLFLRRNTALNSEVRSLSRIADLQSQELRLNQPLVETGDIARSEIIGMQRAIAETQGQISNIRAKYIQELQTEFTRTEEELTVAELQLAQRDDSLRAASILASAKGIVKNVRLTTVGGVLRPGDEVLQIVPTDEKLIVETQVPPRDIAFVKVGQRARVNFDAYDSAIYGSGDGSVVYISPDTLSEQREDGTTNTYYRVNLEVETGSMLARNGRDDVDLQPGMTATAEILTDKTTVWQYLTKPILKTASRSMQER